ncbi:hypothetical protein K8I28_12725 [bacterium]|nr:hypothetical protein [bacterium]
MFNKNQKLILLSIFALFLLLVLFPHWRYMNGSSAGYHPVFAPPTAIPDSIDAGTPTEEFLEIKMIPVSIYNMNPKQTFTEEELRRPFIDIRQLLAFGAILFLLAFILPYLARSRKIQRKDEATVSD